MEKLLAISSGNFWNSFYDAEDGWRPLWIPAQSVCKEYSRTFRILADYNIKTKKWETKRNVSSGSSKSGDVFLNIADKDKLDKQKDVEAQGTHDEISAATGTVLETGQPKVPNS